MGWVWNILLSHSNEELWEDEADEPREICESVERINQWIPQGKLVSLTKPTYATRAGYGMDANLFGGGYKNFDIERFIEVVEAQNWKVRAAVQLWIKGGEEGVDDGAFTTVTLRTPRRKRATRKPAARTRRRG